MGIEFAYIQPVAIYFGQGRFRMLSQLLQEMEIDRCVLVCDPYFAPRAQQIMEENKAVCAVFSEVEPNPQLKGIIQVTELARKHQAQGVIGVGGGSTLDTAKFAAAIALDGGDAIDYYEGRRPFPARRLAMIAVPTTAGTGSEVTQVSVVSHGDEKKTINNPAFMPKAAIVDPELSSSVPPKVTMNTGLDAMAHALEGYWSVNHQPICDVLAIETVRTVLNNLERAWRDGSDMEARSNMAYAALLGGMAFAQPKTAASHACSYPLSEDYHLPHGEACAFTLDSIVMLNADERLDYLCKAVGLEDCAALARRIRELKELGGLRTRLSQLGDVDVGKLAHDCALHPLMKNNPVKLDETALVKMFEALR